MWKVEVGIEVRLAARLRIRLSFEGRIRTRFFFFLTAGSSSGIFLEVKRFASGSFRRDYLYSIFYVPSFFLWKWKSIYSTWFQCRTRLIWCTYYCFGLRSTQNVGRPGVDSRPSLQLNVRFNNSIYCLTMLNPNFTKPANIPQQILFHQF